MGGKVSRFFNGLSDMSVLTIQTSVQDPMPQVFTKTELLQFIANGQSLEEVLELAQKNTTLTMEDKKAIVLNAIKKNPWAFTKAGDFMLERDVVLLAVGMDGLLYKYAGKFKKDKDVLALIGQTNFNLLSDSSKKLVQQNLENPFQNKL